MCEYSSIVVRYLKMLNLYSEKAKWDLSRLSNPYCYFDNKYSWHRTSIPSNITCTEKLKGVHLEGRQFIFWYTIQLNLIGDIAKYYPSILGVEGYYEKMIRNYTSYDCELITQNLRNEHARRFERIYGRLPGCR